MSHLFSGFWPTCYLFSSYFLSIHLCFLLLGSCCSQISTNQVLQPARFSTSCHPYCSLPSSPWVRIRPLSSSSYPEISSLESSLSGFLAVDLQQFKMMISSIKFRGHGEPAKVTVSSSFFRLNN